ncbi:hypothetical protein [Anditalea andensis]|uniref:hypothetical protein n=1 Tax=Anditalea andensis TaxID=1048983 RepID=UPI0013E015C5|nr:hypothetical protein [Anditalea andensis]
MFIVCSLQSCFEVDEPIDVIRPVASLIFDDNSLSDGGSTVFSTGTVTFKVTVIPHTGTVSNVTFDNRYTITGVTAQKNKPLGTLTPNANGVIEFSVPINELRLAEDPLMTFANRGNNAIRVTANTSTGQTTRYFFITFTNS